MRTLMLSVLMAAMALPAFSQSAFVRVVHGSSDAPAVDVLVDGQIAFQGLRYKDYTDYTAVPAGTHTFAVNVSGTGTTVLNSPFSLMANVSYTFYALGQVGKGTLQLMGTGDDPTAPAAASTKIRIVHGASTAPAVDVYATAPFAPLGTPTLTNVPFALASGYLTVPAGNYQARVVPTGTTTVAINSGRVALTGGTVRTIVALDPPTAGGSFEFLILNDTK